MMRHFLGQAAFALSVAALPVGVVQPPLEALLVLASGPQQAVPARCHGAHLAAVDVAAVTALADVEDLVAPGACTHPQLDHSTSTTSQFVDIACGPCETRRQFDLY
jgi:hypothetical protein